MRVTRWGEYGILCSVHLAENFSDKPIGAAEIAERQRIPLQYAQQILHRLKKGQIVESIRGPNGGYRLLNRPENVTLKDILYAAEGNTFELICDENPIREECSSANACCALQSVWKDLKHLIDNHLGSKTLAELVQEEQRPDLVSIS